MFSLEHDRTGLDYSLSLKTYNPNPTDLTGTYLASYLQSVTPHLALGVEAVYQRPTPDLEECTLGYMAKWHHVQKDALTGQAAKDSWIATAQILTQGVWQATYWRKLADKVDAGVDVMIAPAMDPKSRRAVATAGVKYDFRMATFRGQVDSEGKVSALLEQRLSPSFAFLMAGELDHVKVRFFCCWRGRTRQLTGLHRRAEHLQVRNRNHGRVVRSRFLHLCDRVADTWTGTALRTK